MDINEILEAKAKEIEKMNSQTSQKPLKKAKLRVLNLN